MDGRGVCIKYAIEEYDILQTRTLVSITPADEVPEYGVCGVDDTVEVGDYSAYMTYLMETNDFYELEDTAFTYEVTSVEDGVVTYDHVTLEGVVDEHTASLTGFATFDDDSYTLVGRAVIDTIYGERLCDVYGLDGSTDSMMFVGTGDDVIYMMSEDDGTNLRCSYLEFSTEVYGDEPYDTTLPEGHSSERVGDRVTTLVQKTEADGTKWSGIYTVAKMSEIDGVGTTQTFWFGYEPDDPREGVLFYWNDADEAMIETEVVNTVYGAIECEMFEHVAEDGTRIISAVYGAYPVYSESTFADGSVARYTYI